MAGYTMSNGDMWAILITFAVITGSIFIGLEHLLIWIFHHISLEFHK